MRRSRRRRGATLVIVAMLMVTLLGLAAFVLDFGRVYYVETQVQTSADAAALAGVIEWFKGTKTDAPAAAIAVANQNPVEGQDPYMPPDSVRPGTWTDGVGFVPEPSGNWEAETVNAVEAIAHHPMDYSLARIFGFSGVDIRKTAVAAVGFVATTDCLKPWAVSYQALLDALPGEQSIDYDLTAEDIEWLEQNGETITLRFLQGTHDPLTPGNIAQVQVHTPWNGNATYKDVVEGQYCANMQIGPGTILNGDPGAGGGQTAQAIQTLCGQTGNPNSFDCNVKVKLAMYDWTNGEPGANLRVRVKYVGIFTVTRFEKQGPLSQVLGHFSTMEESGGGFSPTPTPIFGAITLVR